MPLAFLTKPENKVQQNSGWSAQQNSGGWRYWKNKALKELNVCKTCQNIVYLIHESILDNKLDYYTVLCTSSQCRCWNFLPYINPKFTTLWWVPKDSLLCSLSLLTSSPSSLDTQWNSQTFSLSSDWLLLMSHNSQPSLPCEVCLSQRIFPDKQMKE